MFLLLFLQLLVLKVEVTLNFLFKYIITIQIITNTYTPTHTHTHTHTHVLAICHFVWCVIIIICACVRVVSRRGDGWRIKGQLGAVIVSLIERSTLIIFSSCFSFYHFPFEKQLAIVHYIVFRGWARERASALCCILILENDKKEKEEKTNKKIWKHFPEFLFRFCNCFNLSLWKF